MVIIINILSKYNNIPNLSLLLLTMVKLSESSLDSVISQKQNNNIFS